MKIRLLRPFVLPAPPRHEFRQFLLAELAHVVELQAFWEVNVRTARNGAFVFPPFPRPASRMAVRHQPVPMPLPTLKAYRPRFPRLRVVVASLWSAALDRHW